VDIVGRDGLSCPGRELSGILRKIDLNGSAECLIIDDVFGIAGFAPITLPKPLRLITNP
jgi:hypothetical protein